MLLNLEITASTEEDSSSWYVTEHIEAYLTVLKLAIDKLKTTQSNIEVARYCGLVHTSNFVEAGAHKGSAIQLETMLKDKLAGRVICGHLHLEGLARVTQVLGDEHGSLLSDEKSGRVSENIISLVNF